MPKTLPIDTAKLEEWTKEFQEYSKAWINATDSAVRSAMETHLDRLMDERGRILGLSEDEIADINASSEGEVEQIISAELETALSALDQADDPEARKFGRRARRALRR